MYVFIAMVVCVVIGFIVLTVSGSYFQAATTDTTCGTQKDTAATGFLFLGIVVILIGLLTYNVIKC